MGLVIDLPREAQERLTAEAARLGLQPAEYARLLIERQLPPEHRPRRQRPPRVTGRGMFAHVPVSSVEYMARKQEEIDSEDRGWLPT